MRGGLLGTARKMEHPMTVRNKACAYGPLDFSIPKGAINNPQSQQMRVISISLIYNRIERSIFATNPIFCCRIPHIVARGQFCCGLLQDVAGRKASNSFVNSMLHLLWMLHTFPSRICEKGAQKNNHVSPDRWLPCSMKRKLLTATMTYKIIDIQ